jgi:hypothetical protein
MDEYVCQQINDLLYLNVQTPGTGLIARPHMYRGVLQQFLMTRRHIRLRKESEPHSTVRADFCKSLRFGTKLGGLSNRAARQKS